MAKDDSVAKSGNQQLPVENKVESLIRVIRGQQVMLDRDLAELYGVETKRLNEQVKRNIERFPEDFMFQLTPNEFDNLKSQYCDFKLGRCKKTALRLKQTFASCEHLYLLIAIIANILRWKSLFSVVPTIVFFVLMIRFIMWEPPSKT